MCNYVPKGDPFYFTEEKIEIVCECSVCVCVSVCVETPVDR